MNGKLLLDTNIMIAIFAGDAEVKTPLAGANEVFVPSIALGELYYGAHKSSRVEANIVRINEFAASSSVLTCDSETSQQYGRLKQPGEGVKLSLSVFFFLVHSCLVTVTNIHHDHGVKSGALK